MDTTTLTSLAAALESEGLLVRAHALPADPLPICGADSDSRFVRPGHLFVCKGAAFRPAYLASALESGAVAYLTGEERADELARLAPGVPALVASDVRRAMALVALEAWGHPDRDLTCVGITGTKGKSTTSYMLRSILDAGSPEPRCAIVGSIETFDGVERAESINTTPEACDLWRHVANARDSHLPDLVMEVSSQALKYDRVVGLHLDVAAFLNIGRDHISPLEHPTWEDYFSSKLRIFRQARTAVVNLATDHLDRVLEAAASCERTLLFSATGPEVAGRRADVWCDEVESGLGRSSFVAHTPSWEARVELPMPGLFNVENALAAICAAELLGAGRDQVLAGLARVSVPGRMELVWSDDRRVVGIVDFAHNAMAFSKFGPSVREEFPGYRVISVFGATGDKAVERRRELPVEAARWSDLLVFTKDDPGHERVEDICREMAEATPAGTPHETVCDRAEAIQHAVDLAFAGTGPCVVCVLARGTEGYQHEMGGLTPAPLDMDLLRAAMARH